MRNLTGIRDQIACDDPSSLLKALQVVGDRYQRGPNY